MSRCLPPAPVRLPSSFGRGKVSLNGSGKARGAAGRGVPGVPLSLRRAGRTGGRTDGRGARAVFWGVAAAWHPRVLGGAGAAAGALSRRWDRRPGAELARPLAARMCLRRGALPAAVPRAAGLPERRGAAAGGCSSAPQALTRRS